MSVQTSSEVSIQCKVKTVCVGLLVCGFVSLTGIVAWQLLARDTDDVTVVVTVGNFSGPADSMAFPDRVRRATEEEEEELFGAWFSEHEKLLGKKDQPNSTDFKSLNQTEAGSFFHDWTSNDRAHLFLLVSSLCSTLIFASALVAISVVLIRHNRRCERIQRRESFSRWARDQHFGNEIFSRSPYDRLSSPTSPSPSQRSSGVTTPLRKNWLEKSRKRLLPAGMELNTLPSLASASSISSSSSSTPASLSTSTRVTWNCGLIKEEEQVPLLDENSPGSLEVVGEHLQGGVHQDNGELRSHPLDTPALRQRVTLPALRKRVDLERQLPGNESERGQVGEVLEAEPRDRSLSPCLMVEPSQAAGLQHQGARHGLV